MASTQTSYLKDHMKGEKYTRYNQHGYNARIKMSKANGEGK